MSAIWQSGHTYVKCSGCTEMALNNWHMIIFDSWGASVYNRGIQNSRNISDSICMQTHGRYCRSLVPANDISEVPAKSANGHVGCASAYLRCGSIFVMYRILTLSRPLKFERKLWLELRKNHIQLRVNPCNHRSAPWSRPLMVCIIFVWNSQKFGMPSERRGLLCAQEDDTEAQGRIASALPLLMIHSIRCTRIHTRHWRRAESLSQSDIQDETHLPLSLPPY